MHAINLKSNDAERFAAVVHSTANEKLIMNLLILSIE